jgi:hypothetical protein
MELNGGKMSTFSNYDKLCHHWVHNRGDHKASNMFSRGDAIYSYGTHYCIARFVRDNTGEEVLLLNPETYSNTTSKHKSHLTDALPKYFTMFYVPNAALDYEATMKYYIDLIQSNAIASIRARQRKEWYLLQVERYKTVAMEFHTRFGKRQLTNEEIEMLTAKLMKPEEISKRVKEAEAKATAIAEAKRLKDKAEQIKKDKANLKLWLKNEKNCLFYNLSETYLRYNETRQVVETSKCAQMDIDKAKTLFYLISKTKEIKEREYENYRIAWNNNKLQIGCHYILRKEINRFAKLMGWIKNG